MSAATSRRSLKSRVAMAGSSFAAAAILALAAAPLAANAISQWAGSCTCNRINSCLLSSNSGAGTVLHQRDSTFIGAWNNTSTQSRMSWGGTGTVNYYITTNGPLYSYSANCVCTAGAGCPV